MPYPASRLKRRSSTTDVHTALAPQRLDWSTDTLRRLAMHLVLITLTIANFAGCGSQSLKPYPVQGRVVFSDGSPVHVGTVELRSREHGVQARGTIAEDGQFQLSTYGNNDGAVAGWHDAVVIQMINVESIPGFKPSKVGVVDPRFASYKTSPLSCQVVPGPANEVTFTVEGITSSQSGPSPHSLHDHRQRPPGGR